MLPKVMWPVGDRQRETGPMFSDSQRVCSYAPSPCPLHRPGQIIGTLVAETPLTGSGEGGGRASWLKTERDPGLKAKTLCLSTCCFCCSPGRQALHSGGKVVTVSLASVSPSYHGAKGALSPSNSTNRSWLSLARLGPCVHLCVDPWLGDGLGWLARLGYQGQDYVHMDPMCKEMISRRRIRGSRWQQRQWACDVETRAGPSQARLRLEAGLPGRGLG